MTHVINKQQTSYAPNKSLLFNDNFPIQTVYVKSNI